MKSKGACVINDATRLYQEALRAWNVFQHPQQPFLHPTSHYTLKEYDARRVGSSTFCPVFLFIQYGRWASKKKNKGRGRCGLGNFSRCHNLDVFSLCGNYSNNLAFVFLFYFAAPHYCNHRPIWKVKFRSFSVLPNLSFWLRLITTTANSRQTHTYADPCRINFGGFLQRASRGKPKMGVHQSWSVLFACLSVFTAGRP
jgi:hypothetical protein